MNVVIDGVTYVPAPEVISEEQSSDMDKALAVSFESRDLHRTVSIRQFLTIVLLKLWQEQEGFSGKRPFGNSGWDSDLLAALITSGFISGSLDEEGYITKCDDTGSSSYVTALIKHMCSNKT